MQDNSNLSVKTFDVGPMLNIVYLIWNNKTKEGSIIDPAWDLDAVLTFIKNNHIKLTSILLTHSHHDHVNSIDKLLEIYDIPIYINKLEAEFWNKSYDNLIRLDSQAEIFLGKKNIQSIHTPGHTPGSCCYTFDDKLIAGDTLFVFGCGRCDLHGGNPEQMFNSLKMLKNNFHKDTIIMPGHNYSVSRQSTLEEEISGNPFFSFNNLKDFVRYRMVDHDKSRDEPYGPINLF
jgi:glyoxylase-like metal-dependent hydrolase (beta-lactamase superfamily II)